MDTNFHNFLTLIPLHLLRRSNSHLLEFQLTRNRVRILAKKVLLIITNASTTIGKLQGHLQDKACL